MLTLVSVVPGCFMRDLIGQRKELSGALVFAQPVVPRTTNGLEEGPSRSSLLSAKSSGGLQ